MRGVSVLGHLGSHADWHSYACVDACGGHSLCGGSDDDDEEVMMMKRNEYEHGDVAMTSIGDDNGLEITVLVS